VLAALANALMLSWRHDDSRVVCEEAIAVAEAIGDDRPALRAMSVLGIDLCYLGRAEEGLELLRDTVARAQERGTPRDVTHTSVMMCEVLVATGRLHEAARVALEGLAVARRLGLERSYGILLAGYAGEALLGTGDWSRAEEVLATAFRHGAAYWTHYPHLVRAELAVAQGDLEEARHHLETAAHGAREPTSATRHARVAAELALLEERPEDAARIVLDRLRSAAATEPASRRAELCALGLRAEAERSVLAAISGNVASLGDIRESAQRLLADARATVAEAHDASDAYAWLALAEAEHTRIIAGEPERWRAAVAAWDALDRPYLAAYCRRRLAEALVAAGTPAEATVFAREAHRVASWLGARPLQRDVEQLAQRARIDLVGLQPAPAQARGAALGLTAREGEVLQLLARGYTNRQIAAELVISVKTASVHVSHILDKLDVSSRREAAAIAHRLAPPAAPPP
jgi:DNA-binding CsgD family transcriptional regulator